MKREFEQNELSKRIYIIIHWSKGLKGQPVLLLSSSGHNSSINEDKNMKLRESICYETIN